MGFDGVYTQEANSDVTFPLLLAAQAAPLDIYTERRDRVPPQPDAPRVPGVGSATARAAAGSPSASAARSVPTSRSASAPASDKPVAPDPRARRGDCTPSSAVPRGRAARLPRRLLHAHADDPDVHPAAARVGSAADLGGRDSARDDARSRPRSPTACSIHPFNTERFLRDGDRAAVEAGLAASGRDARGLLARRRLSSCASTATEEERAVAENGVPIEPRVLRVDAVVQA